MKIAYLLVMFSMAPLLAFAGPRESILFLGDEYRLEMLSRCDSRACTSIDVPFETPPQGSSAADIANMAVRAKQVVLVVDVLRGPSLEMAEHITIARQAYVPRLSVMFGNLKYFGRTAGREKDPGYQVRSSACINGYLRHVAENGKFFPRRRSFGLSEISG